MPQLIGGLLLFLVFIAASQQNSELTVTDQQGNRVTGTDNQWRGASNLINGASNSVDGNSNKITGNSNKVQGSNNVVGQLSPQ